MTTKQKKEALDNALKHYGFSEEFSVYSVNKGSDTRFAIIRHNEHQAVITQSKFMTYDEFNAYLFGVYAGRVDRYNFNNQK